MSRIADRFGRAADTYESATPIQRQVAGLLADRVLGSGLREGARVAEFGSGAGYVARALAPRLRPSLWIATDLAPAMAMKARQVTPLAAVMDAERPALKPGFDLVCSSLVLQWLADPAAAVAAWRALVRPGGRLAVATLIEGSFGEWRSALAEAGAPPTGPRFPSLDEARGWFGPEAAVETVLLQQRHENALAFLKALRAAGVDAAEGAPLRGGTMRRAMAAFEAGGGAISYRVLIAVDRAS
jgi:malonyl-CoA O-methyltransferase